ncbi:glycosyltransferase family 2 protein [Bythopirellula polymerisocia]|uniref:Glycosyl transferase family 2 n=1 Tax=Bythopirellula polymerisocia TaxID=2528003 RepID=A0A5C6CUD1_9BACT|nr:glycosyltransferase family 2 protein [Bythopirellula polymerisocia]TWU28180.1 Glycosyl transferase family 2 [Bythopirellula polymerisocia]
MTESSRIPVSVYIIAKNEADRIGRAIRSVCDWVDEVIVVESGSDDDTAQVAEQAGARVMHNPWSGYGPQKRFAEDQCRNGWLLMLDADEEVSPALASEIQEIFRLPVNVDAFWMQVTDMLPGEDRPKWFAYSYTILRLYNRQRGRCSNHAYQDRVEIAGNNLGELSGRIWHHSFRSWEATVAKLNFYSSQVARDRVHRRMPMLGLRLFTEFPLQFLKCYFGRRFCLRGSMGLAMSITVAYLNLLRLLKTAEAKRQLTREESATQSSSDLTAAA